MAGDEDPKHPHPPPSFSPPPNPHPPNPQHPRPSTPTISIATIASIASIATIARPSMPTPTPPPQAQFFFGEADFFFAKRPFFRAARDVRGAHRVPPWARVEIKLKMSFQALSHSPSHERALALTSPPPDFFLRFMPQRENSKRIQAKSRIKSPPHKNSYRYSYRYRNFSYLCWKFSQLRKSASSQRLQIYLFSLFTNCL